MHAWDGSAREGAAHAAAQIFIIQSTSFGAGHLGAAVERFLAVFADRLASLPQAEFDEQVLVCAAF